MSVANSIGCALMPAPSSFERRDRSESSCVLVDRPDPKIFRGYLVTPEGEFFNLKTGKKKYTWKNKGRNNLYERTQFWIDGKKKNFYVHRIMAELFLPGWDPEFIVNHIDGDTLNNDIDNLELCTQSYNLTEHYWLREVFMRVGHRRTNVVMKVGTVNAIYENKLMEC